MSDFMLCLELFWTFFKIGLFTIGGGQAMIPMIETDVASKGWLTGDEIADFIGISESTPGPFAVNIATYTGMETAGVGGAIMATLGVVLPSVIIIVLVATLFSSFMKKRGVQNVFGGVRSVVTGLLLAVLANFTMKYIFGISDWHQTVTQVDYIGLGMFAVILPLSFIKIKGKKLKPFAVIIASSVLGILCYGFIPV